jgi:SAM-dependent methyltransferase
MAEATGPARARRDHWDAAYRDRGPSGVSWFQPTASVSLDLFDRLAVAPDAAVIDIGGGASTLLDGLIARGFSDLTVLDVSVKALETVRERLGADPSVALIHADLLEWKPERRYDVWHDRAVFHFLVEEQDRRNYLRLLTSSLVHGGIAILATFASDGPEYCSGLPVSRYDASDLTRLLGSEFGSLDVRREEHETPAGALQPFTWLAAKYR